MKRYGWVWVGETLLIWGSVAITIFTGWRIPLNPWICAPLGLIIWAGGLFYVLHVRSKLSHPEKYIFTRKQLKGFPLTSGRAMMNLGVSLGFRSWVTLILTGVFLVVNLLLAHKMRNDIRKRWRLSRGNWARRGLPPSN